MVHVAAPDMAAMVCNQLVRLAAAGVVERSGPRRSVLRVSPRFLAHAEGTAGRRRLIHHDASVDRALRDALATWDEFAGDPWRAARLVRDLLDDRDQWGTLARFGTGAGLVAGA